MTPEEMEAIRERDIKTIAAMLMCVGDSWTPTLHARYIALAQESQRDVTPLRNEIERFRRELAPALAVLEAARAWRVQFYKTPQAPRMAALIAAVDAAPCCDMHNGHCEPPSELCCHWCTEVEHPVHRAGAPCVLDQAAAAPSPSNTQEETTGA